MRGREEERRGGREREREEGREGACECVHVGLGALLLLSTLSALFSQPIYAFRFLQWTPSHPGRSVLCCLPTSGFSKAYPASHLELLTVSFTLGDSTLWHSLFLWEPSAKLSSFFLNELNCSLCKRPPPFHPSGLQQCFLSVPQCHILRQASLPFSFPHLPSAFKSWCWQG